jgi:hypothetical protein
MFGHMVKNGPKLSQAHAEGEARRCDSSVTNPLDPPSTSVRWLPDFLP